MRGQYITTPNFQPALTANTYLEADDYHLTVAALSRLGVKQSGLLPPYEQLAATLHPKFESYFGAETENVELTVHIPVSDTQSLGHLIYNFDQGKPDDLKAYIAPPLRGITSKASVHNQDGESLRPSVLINDSHTSQRRINDNVGLAHTDMTMREQLRALAVEAQRAKQSELVLGPVSITEYLVAQAKRQIAGQDLLDRFTETRFVQYFLLPKTDVFRTKAGHIVTPAASVALKEKIEFLGSHTDRKRDRTGVRRVFRA